MQKAQHKRQRLAGLVGLALLTGGVAWAQNGSDRIEGLRDNSPRWHALTEARLVLAPGQVIEKGTVVLKDGQIVAAGADVAIPSGARVWKLPGRSIYAGFIDLSATAGVPASLRAQRSGAAAAATANPAALSGRGSSARNAQVHPEQSVAALLEPKADELKAARELGFTAVLAAPAQGIFRGQSALLATGEGLDAKSLVLATDVAQHMSHEFERGRNAGYPSSLMGAIALARQTLLDARWYGQPAGTGERREFNSSLASLQPVLQGKQAVVYQADDEQDFLRVAKLRDEFGLKVVLQGNGYEYRRAAQLKELAMPVIVPLNYPAVPEVENPDLAADISLQQLQHWELAPSNLSVLASSGVEFAISPRGLSDAKRDFWPRIRQAVKRGLSPDAALAGLTTVPAKLLGQQQRLGKIAAGQAANLIVASGDLFGSESSEIELAFVDGRPSATEAWQRKDVRGSWKLSGQDKPLVIAGTPARPQARLDGKSCESQLRGDQFFLRWPCAGGEGGGAWQRLRIQGERLVGDTLTAEREKAHQDTPAKPEPKVELAALQRYPAGAFGIKQGGVAPKQILVRGATIWTSGPAGKLERADMLVRDGKIVQIAKEIGSVSGDTTVIMAMDMHLTPGLIDAHSHTAIARGVNEGSSSITAEVRVADVIDATDINIYRELAGGLTAANLLHGSANTIGGQSQVIKLRWGLDAEALKFKEAAPGIKFALGENVKQSNWGDSNTTRYPQTRMGVEQLLRDAFQAARDYQARIDEWKRNPKGSEQPRRDLQLETLVELLQRKREIHIHSYRADEILMFTKIAKEFGLKVAAFQHVLEGYKVAKEIASIGAGSSTFSDWWAYKMEVVDAIPYNGAIMQKVGVVTSFNSDSNELARRLNTEAAKAVRYGGLSEAEALKFVTLNPAKQLGVADRVGSLEVGKDADFVLWNGNPLATTSRAEQTWIEGRLYFSRGDDARMREQQRAERERLIAKALPLRMSGAGAGAAAGRTAGSEATPTQADEARLQAWLHEQARYAESYGNGEWHECTEEVHQ
ncbi:amidohydrolase family protein [Pelomonas sp. SE-A7]|uniref:amidohydrolase family protein n=1 Tax=Pelomonas sp. SE-A7 TaxID=3054953 RepID=UPI00259D075F|nr:amidohydrolase family protein [Pelomonas sp. SE-A7]MDM4764921.1 amidohydrolase family protein [Pelomonas sp. SE-A7]